MAPCAHQCWGAARHCITTRRRNALDGRRTAGWAGARRAGGAARARPVGGTVGAALGAAGRADAARHAGLRQYHAQARRTACCVQTGAAQRTRGSPPDALPARLGRPDLTAGTCGACRPLPPRRGSSAPTPGTLTTLTQPARRTRSPGTTPRWSAKVSLHDPPAPLTLPSSHTPDSVIHASLMTPTPPQRQASTRSAAARPARACTTLALGTCTACTWRPRRARRCQTCRPRAAWVSSSGERSGAQAPRSAQLR